MTTFITKPLVSILICTRDRAEDLRQTLAAMAHICVPNNLPVEMIVVDNASTDNTQAVVRECSLRSMPMRYINEPQPGKGYAYNAAMAAARGEILLFTDDDVRPPRMWITGMCSPILSGQADAVAGGVRIAPHLERPWMTTEHMGWFAASDLKSDEADFMVGANMAYSKRVLAKVPAYDVELGPGALGLNDDILYSKQLIQAGYKMIATNDAIVEHHFEEARLGRMSLLNATKKYAASSAYMAHHWEHTAFSMPRLRLLKNIYNLAIWRIQNRHQMACDEGLSLEEHHRVKNAHFFKQYLIESKRPHNYDKHGLVKRV